ncbi:DUF1295 domain-containing protein [Bacteroidales bacterium OttesenSCG-928-B11]|nr:DUF1295 domain-containing protein [Bacteroidales bacterium OttesenSCG-928-E04]MDL2308229.1 DUF1295 domain-containing protein [Bacteroidales bacterium OttesenSCG-928-C03]MDL2311529.1 DUF1295 domain-containing protein [Bacteroidales bacterium OttesenSCG-928-B11]MDL2325668.1 DUF1295 domain-containing protein [Bacteroidales bacterium OttesenSCG-928-A14]
MEQWLAFYNYFLLSMTLLSVIIFIVLQFITVGYGMTSNNRWGMSINSRLGWVIMELPVFILMTVLYAYSIHQQIKPFNIVTCIIFLLFQAHYIERTFVFPSLMRSTSKMPISVIALGIVFNSCNAYMQGGWLFYFSPADAYPIYWLYSPQFIIGTLLFIAGMTINIHSDEIIRKLRKDKNDTNYYIPRGGLFKYVNSANYFGEILEWIGFAVLCWSAAGWVFVFWTLANILPRASAVYERYTQFFGKEFTEMKRYKIFPFIY